MGELPYPDGYLDMIIASGVLDYDVIDNIGSIVEIHRKWNEGGYFYVTMGSTANSRFGTGNLIERITFYHEGKGSPIHFCDEAEIATLFSGFEALSRSHHITKKASDQDKNRAMLEIILRKQSAVQVSQHNGC